MKLNYCLFCGFIILIAYHVYIIKQMVSVNNQLVKAYGTLSKSYSFGSRYDKRVYMELKEFPGVIFLRSYYGFDRIFYNNISIPKDADNSDPQSKQNLDNQSKVSFYIFKDNNKGNEAPYFYVRKEGESQNKFGYYIDIYLYCRGNVNFISFISLCVSAVLMLLGIVYMGRDLGNQFILTTKTRIIVAIVCYAIFLALA